MFIIHPVENSDNQFTQNKSNDNWTTENIEPAIANEISFLTIELQYVWKIQN